MNLSRATHVKRKEVSLIKLIMVVCDSELDRQAINRIFDILKSITFKEILIV